MATQEYSFEDLLDSFQHLTTRQLETLNEAAVELIRMRRRTEGRKLAASVEVGDIVRIKRNVKPRYLAGQMGTVVGFRAEKITIKLTQGPQGKFRNGEVICPPSMLEMTK